MHASMFELIYLNVNESQLQAPTPALYHINKHYTGSASSFALS